MQCIWQYMETYTKINKCHITELGIRLPSQYKNYFDE